MKKIVLILFCLFSLNSFSQDTLHIPQTEIDEIIAVIDTLIQQDSINNILIKQQGMQIINFENLARQDSMLLMFRRQEVELLERQIELYDLQLKQVDKWYNKRQFGFIIGVISTVGIIHFIDYTLP
jgi:hypothetical protein